MNGRVERGSQDDDFSQILAKKDKDIELAAKIGQSLLERNQELQNRNEFLEEALSSTNDTVVQLRHELFLRASLLHMFADDDTDADLSCMRGRVPTNEVFQTKIVALESENKSLKTELANTKKLFNDCEDKERRQISEWTKHLDNANEKIAHLQKLIIEKNDECTSQIAEVERLLKELKLRSTREKTLERENVDLNQQLHDALTMHDEMATQIIEIQEHYTEVLTMLHDAKEELRIHRQNQSAYRTNSTDSLYDSLASELEASDSGFHSTVNSSRLANSSLDGSAQKMSNELSFFTKPVETIGQPKSNDERLIGDLSSNRCKHSSHSDADVVDVPTSILAEFARRAQFSDRPEPAHAPCNNADSMHLKQPSACLFSDQQSCSHSKIEMPTSKSAHGLEKLQDRSAGSWLTSGFEGNFSKPPLHKTASDESLSIYEGPKIGEPGRPGTRDLDWSIKKLNTKKKFRSKLQVEKEYLKFRQDRGLSDCPAFFYSSFDKRATSMRVRGSRAQDINKHFKQLRVRSKIGLMAVNDDVPSHGVLFRSSILHNIAESSPIQLRSNSAPHPPSPSKSPSINGSTSAKYSNLRNLANSLKLRVESVVHR